MPRPMPKLSKKTPDEVRVNRVKLRDCPTLIKNMIGVKVTRKTVHNWMIHGRKAYSGVRVYLEYEKVLGAYYTTKDAIREFLKEVNK